MLNNRFLRFSAVYFAPSFHSSSFNAPDSVLCCSLFLAQLNLAVVLSVSTSLQWTRYFLWTTMQWDAEKT